MHVRVKTAAGLKAVIDKVRSTPQMIRSEANFIEDLLISRAKMDSGNLRAALIQSSTDNTSSDDPFFGIGNYGPGTPLGDPYHPLGGTISEFLKDYRKTVEYKEFKRQYMRDYRSKKKAAKRST